MMKIYQITFCLFLLLCFVSCNDDTDESIIPDNKEYREIKFYPEEVPLLKSTQSFWHWYEMFMHGDRIGIFAVEKGWLENWDSGKAFAHNKCFYFDGERFLPESEEDRIFVRNEKLEFYAYYPYTPAMDENNGLMLDFTVSPYQDLESHEDYHWGYRENNLMTARYTEELTGDIIPLVFQHCMALIGIDIYHGLDRNATAAVLTDKYIRNHFEITKPDLRYLNDTTKYDINMLPVYSRDGVSSYMALIPPQEVIKDSLCFRLDISGRQYEHFNEDNHHFMSGTGNYYKFTLPCTISLNDTAGGSVTGGGTYNCGDQVTVIAKINSGYSFTGWYENNTKVSNYQYYSFTANGNRLLEAHFERLW